MPGSFNAGSWPHNRSVGAPSDVDIDGRSLQIERAITWGQIKTTKALCAGAALWPGRVLEADCRIGRGEFPRVGFLVTVSVNR